ncbi:MAG: pyridoxamine 5'-phosphate oxidase family protein [Acidimicrobiia bacterium]
MPGHIPFRRIDARLRAARSIWISTTRPDRRPHTTPIWFYWDGRVLYFNVGRTTQKARNLNEVAWVAAHLGDGDDALILEGAVVPIDDRVELERVDHAYRQKYVDPHSGATARFPETEADIPYRLEVRRMMAWEYGVVATRTDFLPQETGGWAQISPVKI